MTADGIVFFILLITTCLVCVKKCRSLLVKHPNHVDAATKSLLSNSGYTWFEGAHEISIPDASGDHGVSQQFTIHGMVKKEDQHFVLKLIEVGESIFGTSLNWQADWEQVKVVYPDVMGVVLIDKTSGRVIKVQVE